MLSLKQNFDFSTMYCAKDLDSKTTKRRLGFPKDKKTE